MRKVRWNSWARKDYFNNIDYLIKEWTETEAQNFIDQVDEIIYILEQGKVDFQNTNYPNVKRCVLRKQITLFYKVIDKKDIELLRFWNNNKDKKNLNL
jgi:hypothetical protein